MKASAYKKLSSEKTTIEDVKLPSGAVFKMRTPPIEQWVIAGMLPVSLASKMQMAAKAPDEKIAAMEVLKTFTEKDFQDAQDMSRRLLSYAMVEPRIWIDPAPCDDPKAVSLEDLLDEDFKFLMKWVWSGGMAGDKLAKFHRKRQSASVAGTSSP